jgi:hypothetical protein
MVYSRNADRLFAGMKTFGGEATFTEETVVRSEYPLPAALLLSGLLYCCSG